MTDPPRASRLAAAGTTAVGFVAMALIVLATDDTLIRVFAGAVGILCLVQTVVLYHRWRRGRGA